MHPVYITAISVGQVGSQNFLHQCKLPKEGKLPLFVLYGKEEKVNIDDIDEEIRQILQGDEVSKQLDVIIGLEDNTLYISNSRSYHIALFHDDDTLTFLDDKYFTPNSHVELTLTHHDKFLILISAAVYEAFKDDDVIKSIISANLTTNECSIAQHLVDEASKHSERDKDKMKIVIFSLTPNLKKTYISLALTTGVFGLSLFFVFKKLLIKK